MSGPGAALTARAAGTRIPATHQAPSLAREFVRKTLTGWDLPACLDDAELVASELSANAVTHSGTEGVAVAEAVVEVRLLLRRDILTVEVWDAAGGEPAIPCQSEDAESGRGLLIVGALSRRWGSCAAHGPRKVVWAELPSA
ncbi:ATP-binding protein [Streptomyces sp. DW26H14]|uniref:ATP-binding protein n=1 Tax=Streptomyces sp. DW26H14 TaxID=3435395 RepID=UPI00403D5917